MISLKDRYSLIEFMGFSVPYDPGQTTLGTQFIETNKIILEGFKV